MTARTNPPVEPVVDGFRFVEGPAWLDADQARRNGLGTGAGLFFSDIEDNRQYFLSHGELTVVRAPSGAANGNALELDGRILTCEHGARRVARRTADGEWTTVVDRIGGRRLNSPNDICVRADGSVFFTDPPYGIEPHDAELDVNGVYRIDPTGTVHLLDGGLERPNGLAVDPDRRSLWVADTESGSLVQYRFDGPDGDRIVERSILGGLERPDGMAFDSAGNLLVAVRTGIAVIGPDRHRVLIPLPVRPANLCFGGARRADVWVVARGSIFRLAWPRPGLPLIPA